jgi:membrane-associated protein
MILSGIIYFLNEFQENLLSVFDPEMMIQYGGLLIILLAVYAQTGLFFCFFIPSGAFLFTGGLFIATGQLHHSLIAVCIYSVIASVCGCVTAYWFGRKTGPLLYKRKDSRFLRQAHLRAAEIFFKKYGQFALTAGLLFPITRTFVPIVAGLIKISLSRFTLLVLIGSVLWTPVLISSGYLVGIIPVLKKYMPYIIPIFVLVVTIPLLIRIVREFKNAGKEN